MKNFARHLLTAFKPHLPQERQLWVRSGLVFIEKAMNQHCAQRVLILVHGKRVTWTLRAFPASSARASRKRTLDNMLIMLPQKRPKEFTTTIPLPMTRMPHEMALGLGVTKGLCLVHSNSLFVTTKCFTRPLSIFIRPLSIFTRPLSIPAKRQLSILKLVRD